MKKLSRESIGTRKVSYHSKTCKQFAEYLQWRFLNHKILGWQYRPKLFRFRNNEFELPSVTPDFKIVRRDGSVIYYNMTKTSRHADRVPILMARDYPDVDFRIISEKKRRLIARLYKRKLLLKKS